ncbi:MAG: aminotransferase class III-fold pyridoxal phosphate-dependent enzyme [Nitrospinota bacterium]
MVPEAPPLESHKTSGPRPQPFARSEALLDRACRVIPGGSQTFSKGRLQWSRGGAPLFLTRGRGSHVWDVDGNEYIDFVNGLAPILLGYCDPDVDAAVRNQLERGVLLSLSTELEIELAELLGEIIPCAEMVRFAKNGSDACAGAIRLARAHTGRDHVAVCGYHGWQDWYIGSTSRHKGVPEAVRALTHPFDYNDAGSLKASFLERPDEFAAVILEPFYTAEPESGFLEEVQRLAHEHGTLLIFDEVISGFRHHLGGAQSLFGVTPDLAALGKAMANGFPLSALVGRREIMKGLEEVFFSFTNGGETLSLAASLATIRKIQAGLVHPHLARLGTKLIEGVREALRVHGLAEVFSIAGRAPLTQLQYRKNPEGVDPWALKTLVRQEMVACGVLTTGVHNLSYSHSDADIDRLLSAYHHTFKQVAHALSDGSVERRLRGEKAREILSMRSRS